MSAYEFDFASILPDQSMSNNNVYLIDPEEDQDKTSPKLNKLKTPKSRRIDWTALVKRIQKQSGCTIREIARKSGVKETTVHMMASSCDHWEAGDKALELLALYLANTDTDVPLIGDYHPDIEA